MVWVMLNPSTADEWHDDPTIRRCAAFSRRFGACGLSVVNLYGLRATDPGGLWQHPDPIGPENDRRISEVVATAAARGWPIICAWGAHGKVERATAVLAAVHAAGSVPFALGLTKNANPRHPLYLPAATELTPYRPGWAR